MLQEDIRSQCWKVAPHVEMVHSLLVAFPCTVSRCTGVLGLTRLLHLGKVSRSLRHLGSYLKYSLIMPYTEYCYVLVRSLLLSSTLSDALIVLE